MRPIVERNNYKSKKIWVDVPGEYPQRPEFEVSGGNLTIFDAISPGSEITVDFSIRGNESNKNGTPARFNTLSAFKVTVVKAAAPVAQQAAPVTASAHVASPADDNLPF